MDPRQAITSPTKVAYELVIILIWSSPRQTCCHRSLPERGDDRYAIAERRWWWHSRTKGRNTLKNHKTYKLSILVKIKKKNWVNLVLWNHKNQSESTHTDLALFDFQLDSVPFTLVQIDNMYKLYLIYDILIRYSIWYPRCSIYDKFAYIYLYIWFIKFK